MKTGKLIQVSFFTLLLVALVHQTACTVQTGDDDHSSTPGDDDDDGTPPDAGTPNHDECEVSCAPVDGCSTSYCDQGECRTDSACDADEVCDESLDACVAVTMLPTTHGISCFLSGNTLSLTISGKLTDAVHGGTLTAPTHVSIASDAIAGSWNTTTLSTTYQVALSSNETSLGGVISKTITVPSDMAQRFTLLAWPSTGTALRLDLSDWSVTGDGCARIADGGGETSTSDGDVIGRAPLCANACSDGNDSTADACLATGCDHGGTTTVPGNGTITCSESGSNTNVTVSSGILSHLFTDGLAPTSSWSVRFGYGATDQEAWVSDTVSYMLTMPNTVTALGVVLHSSGGTDYYLDLNEYNFSGSCYKTCTDTSCGIAHTPPTSSPTNGTLSCSEPSSGTTNVVVSGGILAHVYTAFNGASPSSLRFGYGLTDTATWSSDSATYTLTMPSSTPVFNLFVRDSNGVDHWFNVNQFDTSGTCSHGTNEFAHTAQTTTVANGTISCSLSGSDLTVSISGGILAHLLGTAVTPTSTWKIEYASVANPSMPYTSGKAMASWVSDTWTYTLTISSSEQGIQPALTDTVNGYRWLDLAEYNVSGASCYVSNGKIYH